MIFAEKLICRVSTKKIKFCGFDEDQIFGWGGTQFLHFQREILIVDFVEKLNFAFLVEKLDFSILVRKLNFVVLAGNSILLFWRETRFCGFGGKKTQFLVMEEILDFEGLTKKLSLRFRQKIRYFQFGRKTQFQRFSRKKLISWFYCERLILRFWR